MAAYLRFYQFDSSPFDGSVTKRGMVLGTQSLRGALSQVKQGLGEDAPRICLSGSEGVGKTSFCRALPKLLAQEAMVAVVIEPRRPWDDIRAGIAKKFGIEGGALARRALAEARPEGKRLVIAIDRAELLSHDALDELDQLLQYKDDEGKQLLHCVMLANLEAAATGAETPLLWWLDKFTTLQLQFSPIPVEGIRHYVEKHLAKAGWAGGELFTRDAMRAIHANTGGLPAAINQLCERILVEGGIRGVTSITGEFIDELCGNAMETPKPTKPLTETADLSADLSFADFGASPTAQQMLDDPNARSALEENEDAAKPTPRLRPERDDIASLLVTQDSPEHLRTASDKAETTAESDAIELEDDPHEKKFADFYDTPRNVTSTMGRARMPSAVGKRGGRSKGMLIGAVIVIALAWFVHSQWNGSSELMETAEERIGTVLEKAPKLALKAKLAARTKDEVDEADTEDLADAEATLPPSLIDRADEIVARAESELVPVPEAESTGESAGGDDDPGLVEADAATRPADPDAAPGSLAARAQTQTSRGAPSTPGAKPTQKRPTTEIPSEMIVINEYTAIPEAASTAPKLPLPSNDEAAPQDEELAQTPNDASDETPAPSAPARLAPDTAQPTGR